MRAEHRGIKEMDIILGGYVREHLAKFSEDEMALLEEFMQINDQELYQVILGNESYAQKYALLVENIRAHIQLDIG